MTVSIPFSLVFPLSSLITQAPIGPIPCPPIATDDDDDDDDADPEFNEMSMGANPTTKMTTSPTLRPCLDLDEEDILPPPNSEEAILETDVRQLFGSFELSGKRPSTEYGYYSSIFWFGMIDHRSTAVNNQLLKL